MGSSLDDRVAVIHRAHCVVLAEEWIHVEVEAESRYWARALAVAGEACCDEPTQGFLVRCLDAGGLAKKTPPSFRSVAPSRQAPQLHLRRQGCARVVVGLARPHLRD